MPQLVEELFRRHVPARGRVLDPFAGSGTTLVQALESGLDSAGVDIAAFNCLLMRVKTGALQPVRARARSAGRARPVRAWRGDATGADAVRATLVRAAPRATAPAVPLARAASTSTRTCCASCSRAPRARRGGRRTSTSTSRKAPQLEPYWCHKHRRECRPVEHAEHFLRRYTLDTLTRLKEFARVRSRRSATRAARRRARARPAGRVRRSRDLAAVSRADRLPRAAPLRV